VVAVGELTQQHLHRFFAFDFAGVDVADHDRAQAVGIRRRQCHLDEQLRAPFVRLAGDFDGQPIAVGELYDFVDEALHIGDARRLGVLSCFGPRRGFLGGEREGKQGRDECQYVQRAEHGVFLRACPARG
jgi:hypothetical protein